MPQTPTSDVQSPAAPAIPIAPVGPGGLTMVRPGVYTPTAVWKGFVAQRKELARQLKSLGDDRNSLTSKLSRPDLTPTDRKGTENRVADLDARIKAVDQQLAIADAQVAQAAAIPGAVVEDVQRIREHNGPPTDMVVGTLFMALCVFPITLTFCRRLWRRGSAAASSVPKELMERMSRLDQAVDSIAVEVERIGEGQRFITRLFGEGGERARVPGIAEAARLPSREASPLDIRTPH